MENNFYQQTPLQPEGIIYEQEPESNVKPKKKLKFGLPQVFMIIAVILAEGIIPLISSLSNLFVPTVSAFIQQFFDFDEEAVFATSTAVSNILSLIISLLIIAVYFLFAYLAYKSIGGAVCFLGTVFVAQKISWLLIGYLPAVISSISSVTMAIDYKVYSVISLAGSGIGIIIDIIETVIAVAVGILLLMLVEKKLSLTRKKKEKESR